MKNLLLFFLVLFLFTACNSTKERKERGIQDFSFYTNTDNLQKNVGELYDGKYSIQRTVYTKFIEDPSSQFSVVVIPDTQGYIDYTTYKHYNPTIPFSNADILERQINFIKSNSIKNGGDFSFAMHVGDIVNWPISYKKEWDLAVNLMIPLIDEIPYIFVPGNHDFTWWNYNYVKNLSQYKSHFGPNSKFFKNKEFVGGNKSNGTDIWCTFEACGIYFIVIGLEYEPSDSSLLWAEKVINNHPGYPVIIVTHGYLETSKNIDDGQSNYTSKKYRKAEKYNLGQQIWEKFISRNDSIFMVLCGHSFNGNDSEGLRTDKNIYDNTVYSILANYQGRRDVFRYYGLNDYKTQYCGDGWLRILDFDLIKKTIHSRTYSTEFEAFELDEDSDFYLKIDWDWEERFPSCKTKIEK